MLPDVPSMMVPPVLDHLDGHAVLDRVARVEGLDLGEHQAGNDALREAVDADEGRLADGVEDVRADLHGAQIVHAGPLGGSGGSCGEA